MSGPPTFAECFLKWRDKFLVYGDFCSNLPHAQDLIDELCNTRELVKHTVVVSVFDFATVISKISLVGVGIVESE